jgi:RES domain-containing protein
VRWTGQVFRAHNPRWSFSPTSGDGAARYGGRFNPVGMPALYTSASLEAAWREAQQGFPFKPQPLTICAYDVDCADVADLTDPAARAALHADAADLSCAWEALALRNMTPPSWVLASRLSAAGVAAIIVPSFAPGATSFDRNIVFWRWADAPPHQVRVVDDERRLPRNARSWT